MDERREVRGQRAKRCSVIYQAPVLSASESCSEQDGRAGQQPYPASVVYDFGLCRLRLYLIDDDTPKSNAG